MTKILIKFLHYTWAFECKKDNVNSDVRKINEKGTKVFHCVVSFENGNWVFIGLQIKEFSFYFYHCSAIWSEDIQEE